MFKLYFCSIFTFLLSFSGIAQYSTQKIGKVKKFIRLSDYVAAAEIYENYLKLKPDDEIAQAQFAALLYFDLKNYEKANPYLKKTLSNSLDTATYGLALLYSEIYLGKFEDAKALAQQLQYFASRNSATDEFHNELAYYTKIINYNLANSRVNFNTSFQAVNLGKGVNSAYADYVPVNDTNENYILVTSRRKLDEKERMIVADNAFKEKMFSAKREGNGFSKLNFVNHEFNGMEVKKKIGNVSFVSLSPDGKQLYLYKEGTLWKSQVVNQTWSKPEKFQKSLLDVDYTNHGSITADGNTFYFTSEIKGKKSGLDIYFIKKNEDGTWSPAQPLAQLNSNGNEQGVQISADGKTIYFASDSLPGFGGYDIFKSTFDGNRWSDPINMGYPFNSPADDIFFLPNESAGCGYFSSNRLGTSGNFDVYRYYTTDKADFEHLQLVNVKSKTDTTFELTANAIENYNQVLLTKNNPQLTYFRLNDSAVYTSLGDLKHAITQVYPKKIEIEQQLNCSGCTFKEVNYALIHNQTEKTEEPILAVKNYPQNLPSPPVSEHEELQQHSSTEQTNSLSNKNNENTITLNFGFNKNNPQSEDLKQLVSKLKESKKYQLQIIGHTDVQGSKSYNLKLSKKRANAVKKFLISHNIDKEAIAAVKGLGESQPAINCGTHCDRNSNAKNRRVEVKVILLN